MWNRLTCVAAGKPAVALADAKEQLRVDFDDDDKRILRLVAGAQRLIHGPQGIGVALTSSTWRLSLDRFEPVIEIPLGPVTAISSITYVDETGATQTLTAVTDFLVDLDRRPARVVPAFSKCWPPARCQPGAVKITFVAGPTSPDEDLVQAILLTITDWYSQPEALGAKPLVELPQRAKDLLFRRGPASVG